MKLSDVTDGALNALSGIADYGRDLVHPTIRLGVTGLSRAGKTVFITALVNNLLQGGRLPAFSPLANGRIRRVYLQPQPDDDIPRFAYEKHLEAMTGKDRRWPQSTTRISQLRLSIEYEPRGWLGSRFSPSHLNIDIVDYPGEWLLDLPLLHLSFDEWSLQVIRQSHSKIRKPLARDWHRLIGTHLPDAPENEDIALQLATAFTAYLGACRNERVSLSSVPPGRFLMPGDMADSPALTFAPLDMAEGETAAKGSLHAMMARRFEAYKSHVVKPFYRDHFCRLDRQIVLVDALAALNAGPEAVEDLQTALTDIMRSFRPGRNSWLSSLLARRIDRILFAATKADHLHHSSHDRLQNILALLAGQAMQQARSADAEIDSLALASVRATREARVTRDGQSLECIAGIAEAGQSLDGTTFDGKEEVAIFPGDLPENPQDILQPGRTGAEHLRFIRFRPPLSSAGSHALPHIRLDRAMEFLFGDRL